MNVYISMVAYINLQYTYTQCKKLQLQYDDINLAYSEI